LTDDVPDARSSRDRAVAALREERAAAFFGSLAELLEITEEAGLSPGGLRVHGTLIPVPAGDRPHG
jgi:hypothetical protein